MIDKITPHSDAQIAHIRERAASPDAGVLWAHEALRWLATIDTEAARHDRIVHNLTAKLRETEDALDRIVVVHEKCSIICGDGACHGERLASVAAGRAVLNNLRRARVR